MGFYQWLETYDILAIIIRLLLTSVCSGMLGFEREKRNQAAGFRTYMIVSNASALVMMTNQFINQTVGTGDPVRMGAQVISGIGFLGAGAILVTRNQQVRGLTTAAGLWASAIVGMALGSGYYAGGIACFLFIYISLKFLAKIDSKISRSPRMANLYCELNRRRDMGNLIRFAQSKKYRVSNVEINSLTKEVSKDVAVAFVLHTDGKTELDALLKEFEQIEGLSFIAQV